MLSSGSPSWRRAIARRTPSGSSRTWTAYRPWAAMNGETKNALSIASANGVATARLARPERVEVPLAERVVDLDDHDPQLAEPVAAQVEARPG